MKKVILSVIVLAAVIGMIEAAPFQTMGLLRTPDAYVIPHKSAQLVLAGYYRNVERPSYVDPDKNGLNFYGMLGVGLFDRVQLDFFGGDYVYFLNAKVKLLQETPKIPQIAVGMDNILSPVNRRRAQDYKPYYYWDPEQEAVIHSSLRDSLNLGWIDHPDKTDYEYFSPYLVASKQVVMGGIDWMFNLGIGANRYIGQVDRSRWFSGLFASVEISPWDNFAVQGEYDGKDFNAGLKYSIKNFGIRLGAEAVEDLAKGSEGNGYENNLRIALGLSYLFDRFSDKNASIRPDLGLYATNIGTEPVIVPTEPVAVATTETGQPAEVAIVTPGTQLPTPGIVEASAYKELSPEVKDLLAELRLLREERQKAQKALEDLRKWLQELKEENQ
ncbi:MAG: YjbH domain-containing protein [Candidatus Cloacimonetes bacterium]|nr:YjbH domain-containing protein [Candidatus Cloacimonadota bacterium]MDY0367170.1 hypothetical protein [Candidatus Syntrophosphaera sp.]HOY84671.1 hypothetical protein [Candidatus Syntrophosphaera sp.]